VDRPPPDDHGLRARGRYLWCPHGQAHRPVASQQRARTPHTAAARGGSSKGRGIRKSQGRRSRRMCRRTSARAQPPPRARILSRPLGAHAHPPRHRRRVRLAPKRGHSTPLWWPQAQTVAPPAYPPQSIRARRQADAAPARQGQPASLAAGRADADPAGHPAEHPRAGQADAAQARQGQPAAVAAAGRRQPRLPVRDHAPACQAGSTAPCPPAVPAPAGMGAAHHHAPPVARDRERRVATAAVVAGRRPASVPTPGARVPLRAPAGRGRTRRGSARAVAAAGRLRCCCSSALGSPSRGAHAQRPQRDQHRADHRADTAARATSRRSAPSRSTTRPTPRDPSDH
jgi:hypothetical protein